MAVLSLICTGPSQDEPTTGYEAPVNTTKAGYLYCESEADFNRAVEFIAVGDREAAGLFITTTPGCGITQWGDTVYIEDSKLFSASVKVRRKGAVRSFWTMTEAIN